MRIHAAFSFIEILIVLSITAILSVMSFPFLRNTLSNFEQHLLQTQLLHAITFARQSARTLRLPVMLCKSNNQHNCAGNWIDGQLIYVDKYGDGMMHSEQQVIKFMPSPKVRGKIYWRSFPRYRSEIRFEPLALSHQDNGTFWFCSETSKNPIWAIILNEASRTRMLYADNGDIKDGSGNQLSCDLSP